jgi:hypothetical protein
LSFAWRPGISFFVRRTFLFWIGFGLLAAALSAGAATGRVFKVLPQMLDTKGRHALSPSLYERDAYQAHLRLHAQDTNVVSGLRFAVHWRARGTASTPLKLRIELRGATQGELPARTILETEVKPGWFSHWTALPIQGEDYRKFGQVTAWRVTLWEGDWLLDEQKSFLW